MTDHVMKSSPRRISRGGDHSLDDNSIHNPMARRETLELVPTYHSIAQPKVRKNGLLNCRNSQCKLDKK